MMNEAFKAAFLLSLVVEGCSPAAPPPPPDRSTTTAAVSADTAVRLGRLVNPADGTVIDHAIVLVKGDRITYAGKDDVPIPPSAHVIDWSSYTGLPGLVDAHTHVSFVTDGLPDVNPFERRGHFDNDTSLRLARENAFAALKAGVTTMIDKGCANGVDRKLKSEIERGATLGPRLFVAIDGLYRIWPSSPERRPGNIRIAADIVPEIQREVQAGSDLIKMWGDYCSDRVVECQQTFSADEMRIAVEEAHRLGRPVAIHVFDGAATHDAVLAGADAVDHPAGLDQATLDEMVRRGTVYIPTVDHNRYYDDHSALFGMTPLENQARAAFVTRVVETIRAAHRAGVRIAMGSDTIFNMFGQNTRELSWFVKAGMTPMEALRAATMNSAASIHRDKEIGAVAPGYFADIVAVDGDPLADINVVIQRVRGVMVGGKAVDLASKPADPAPSQTVVAPDVPAGADAARDRELKQKAEAILGAFTNSDPAFVSGGKKVVFVSDRDGPPQLYLADAGKPGAPPLRITGANDRVSHPAVTPDGKSIVFLSDRLGSGYRSLFRVDVDGKNLSELTPGVELLRDPPFVPTKASPPIVVHAARSRGEWRKRLFVQGLAPGDKPRLVYVNPFPGRTTDVSTDGQRALVLQQTSPSDSALVLVDLATALTRTIYPPAGKKAWIFEAKLTADRLRAIVAADDEGERVLLVEIDVATGEEKARRVEAVPVANGLIGVACSPAGKDVALSLTTGDHTLIRILDTSTLKLVREVTVPVGTGTIGAFSEDGKRLALTFSTFSNPMDIHSMDVGTGRVTPLRQDARPGLAGLPDADASLAEVRSFDGTRIPVNLFLPTANKGARRPSPVLVMFHSGPAESATAGWNGMRRFYAAQGYAIVEPNIRGSSGFGRAYEAADNGRKRIDALKDAETVARWVAAQPWADKDRLVVSGMDYGGYLVLLELTRRADLWRAGIDLVGIPNLRSLFASWIVPRVPSLVADIGDPSKDGDFLDSISPLRDVASIKAPLFVYAVATDPWVPRSEQDTIVRTLRDKRIPVEYMVVSDEEHYIYRRSNQVEMLARSTRFLEKALGGTIQDSTKSRAAQ